jgi:mevalonate kinase
MQKLSQQQSVTISAPGKLMLFGEHAVVYDRPCLVTAVDQRMRATVELIETPELQIEAPDVQVMGYGKAMVDLGEGEIPKGAKFVEFAVKHFMEEIPLTPFTKGGARGGVFTGGIKITTQSEFSSQFGFGSSSASTVCVIKALAQLSGKKLSNKQIFTLAYKTVLAIQGKGSGFDVAAAVYGGTLYFVTGGKVITPLTIPSIPLLVGYSGVKADTVTLINQVKERANKYPQVIEGIYDAMEMIVPLAKEAIERADWQTVGELMNINQGYLSSLGVSSGKLEGMIFASRDAGAYGAKLSGAGGGDCMIMLAPEDKVKAVKEGIRKAGGENIHVQTNAEGVRVEKGSNEIEL